MIPNCMFKQIAERDVPLFTRHMLAAKQAESASRCILPARPPASRSCMAWQAHEFSFCCVAGAKGYYAVILFQQIASIGNNISIQIVAGISMKVRSLH